MKLKNAKKDNLTNREIGWLPQIAVGIALVFTFFVTLPTELFVPNQSDFFWFDLWFMVKHMLLAGGIAFLLFELICTLCRRLPGKGYLIALSIFLGVAIALYIQGYYLCMNNEVLVGGEPDWSTHTGSMILNLVIWLAIIAACIAVGLAKPKYLKKACIFAPLLIVVMQCASLASNLITYSSTSYIHMRPFTSDYEEHVCSQNGDAFVFMMDTMDTRLFSRIQKEDPDKVAFLNDFVYYDNTASVYRKTDPSIVSTLTGAICKNEEPFYTYCDKAFENNAFFRTLQENGYTINIYGGPQSVFPSSVMEQVENLRSVMQEEEVYKNTNIIAFIKLYIRMVGYRCLPSICQPVMYDNYYEAFSDMCSGNYTGENDVKMLTRMREDGGYTIDNSRSFFKFYMMRGAHVPYAVDRDGNTVTADTYDQYEQCLGSFTILNQFIDELKDKGVYSKTTIIVMADHGDGMICNPILLVKYPHEESDTLKVSHAPVSLLDIRATILYGLGLEYEEFGTPVHAWEGVEGRERIFYAYDWMRPTDGNFYLNTLTEYIVPTDAKDLDNYLKTGNTYSKKSSH